MKKQHIIITIIIIVIVLLVALSSKKIFPLQRYLKRANDNLSQESKIHDLPVPEGVERTRQYLAERLSRNSKSIVILEVEERYWPNSCLGIDQKDEICAQVITPGYKIVMKAQDSVFAFHTNKDGSAVREVESETFKDESVTITPSETLPTTTAESFGMFCHLGRTDLMKDAGVQWVRTAIDWGEIAPQKSVTWKWTKVDREISRFMQADFNIVANIKTGSLSWATECKGDSKNPKLSCPPKNWDEYYEFVFEVASHLKGKAEYFIIENEANVPFFWDGTKEQFLKARQTAYKAIHDANPKAKLLDTGFTSPSWGVVVARDLYEKGKIKEALDLANNYEAKNKIGKVGSEEELAALLASPGAKEASDFVESSFANPASFDIAAVHFYAPSRYLALVIQWVKDEMEENGHQKPIWITEMGIKNINNELSPEEISAELSEKYRIAIENGVEVSMWYPLIETCDPHEAFFGKVEALYDKEGDLLPAGKAYKRAVEELNTAN